MKNKIPILDTSYILSVLDQRKLLAKYIKFYPPIKKKICSPFRKDANPECIFYIKTDKRLGIQKLYFVDFAQKQYNGDVFDCITHVLKKEYDEVTLPQVCDHIAFTFKIHKYNPKGWQSDKQSNPLVSGNLSNTSPHNKKISNKKVNLARSIIKPTYIDYDKAVLNYYSRINVNKYILNRFRTYSLSKFVMQTTDGNQFMIEREGYKPLICYEFGAGYRKTYNPYTKNKRIKFFNNCPATLIQGLNQLNPNYYPNQLGNDLLIITKSYKDVKSLFSIGVPAIAPHSETIVMSAELIAFLRTRFKEIVLLFDDDPSGNRGAIDYYMTHEIPFIKINKEAKIKDFSDLVLRTEIQEASNYLLDLLIDTYGTNYYSRELHKAYSLFN